MTQRIFACIPNISEGRTSCIPERCAAAIVEAGALLAHQTSDAVHNRSVFTFLGDEEAVFRAALSLAAIAAREIDLRAHRGAHPRIGALDVLPFVPLRDATPADAVALAERTAAAIARVVGVPALLYAAAARTPERALLADVRRGEFEGLAARAAHGERPDYGCSLFHPSAGTIAVGARGILTAFNVVLLSSDLRLAQTIARTLRERHGGLRTVRALGIRLDAERVQISCNLTDPEAVPPHRIVALVRLLAAQRGVRVATSELIGLAPRAVFTAAAQAVLSGTCTDMESEEA